MKDLYSIGELSVRTGLPVRTIRFYADVGVVPESGRTPAGYRRYDDGALARLELVCALRELGLDLATIRQVVERQVDLAGVAAAHAAAATAQIRLLQARRAVLSLIAARGTQPAEVSLLNRLARLSAAERERLLTTFIDETFGNVDANPDFVALMRASLPELPAEPTPQQLDDWVTLAELINDPEFRASARRAAEHQAANREEGLHGALTETVRATVERALADGVDPAAADAGPIVDEIVAAYTAEFGAVDSPAYRAALRTRVEIGGDPHAERYFQLVARISGTPEMPTLQPVVRWLTTALDAHPLTA
ncbi:MerR family transcriptional regulator [Cryptosporangium phraense]|uniref:MerR family transcriptional regulator n=1 Tax=Cryptosporangium phraense TaxID=2593070 RepID=UPI00197A9302|nr:MerR family transcriptional regulator [Cryptosporangium phraense]